MIQRRVYRTSGFMEERVAEFLKEDVGCIFITDAEGRFLQKDERVVLSEKAKNTWKISAPEPSEGQKGEVWELVDSENQQYYNITTSTFSDNGRLYQIHHLVDISEYTAVYKNLSAISVQWEEMSRFQSTVLKNLSEDYTAILPDSAKLFCTDEIMMFVRRKDRAECTVYNSHTKEKTTLKSEKDHAAFDLKAGDCYGDFVCFINETVAGYQYCMLLKQGGRFTADRTDNIMVQSAIRLFIENGLLKSQIIYESEHDRMTGLYNKGKYMSLLNAKFGKPQSIAIYNMDVNNLKYMNDTYGHEMGDKLIIKAAKSLMMMESENVWGFRMGGDEFMMIAVDCSMEEARQIKARWEDAVRTLNAEDDGIVLVVACGMAYGHSSDSLEDLLKQADELMYEDKKLKKSQKS